MLQSLTALSVETDGRFASAEEVQFLKDYIDSIEQRISIYTKIRDHSIRIVHRVEEKKHAINPKLFELGSRNVREICQRDLIDVLRLTATALLFDDLERLRSGFLIWYRTIVAAFNYKSYTAVTYKVLHEVVLERLDLSEKKIASSAFLLNHTLLKP